MFDGDVTDNTKQNVFVKATVKVFPDVFVFFYNDVIKKSLTTDPCFFWVGSNFLVKNAKNMRINKSLHFARSK